MSTQARKKRLEAINNRMDNHEARISSLENKIEYIEGAIHYGTGATAKEASEGRPMTPGQLGYYANKIGVRKSRRD